MGEMKGFEAGQTRKKVNEICLSHRIPSSGSVALRGLAVKCNLPNVLRGEFAAPCPRKKDVEVGIGDQELIVGEKM